MLVRDLLEERDISQDELAALLTERGVTITAGPNIGAPITGAAVSRRRGQELPRAWATALGMEAPTTATTPGGSDPGESPDKGTDGSRARRETPPRRPAEARIEIPPEPGAKKRIAGAYRFAGAALAAGAGSEGVAVVFDDQADPIAELWVQAAAENPWAARFVNMMNAGGVGGDLAAAHLYLVGATFYVLGAGIPGGDAIFSKYAKHRVVAPRSPAAEANGNAAEQPEGPQPAAEGAVVDGLG